MNRFKRIGILFALKKEYKGFTDNLSSHIENVEQKPFFCSKFFYKNYEIIFTVSGLGKVRAAACTQHLIDKYQPELIINVGSSGGVCSKVSTKDTYFVATIVEYDFMSLREGTPVIGVDNELLNTAQKINLPFAVLGSADQNADTQEKKERLHKTGITIADWEGIAVAKTCNINNVKFALFKIVTDTSNKDFSKEFSQNVFQFNKHLNDVVFNFLDVLDNDAK